MAARNTAAQQRERRARVALFALLGVLVVVCGIQVPRFLHHGGGSSAPPPPAPVAAAPAVLASAVTAAPTASHLDRFAAKDPFHALVRTAGGTTAATAPASTAKPKQSPAQPAPSAKSTPPKPAAQPQPTLTVPFAGPRKVGTPGALVVLDGRKLKLLPGDLIPQAAPILRVLSIGPERVRVKLLAGTLADGTSVVTLPLRRKLVLRNTTDGTTFVFRYLAPTLVPPRATPPPKA